VTRRLLGVDVGGTGIKLGAVEVDTDARLVAHDHWEGHAPDPPARTLAEVAERLHRLVTRAGWDAAEGIGMGVAGLVHREAGTVVTSPNLPTWQDAPVREILRQATGLPVRFDNDANAFALGEWMWGAGGRVPHSLFLTLGTGVGGACIADGRLLRGATGFAGEPGHATLVLDGIPCPCGNQGCAERYLGNKDLVRAARRHEGFGEDARLVGADPLTPRALAEAAQAGSGVAREVFEGAGRALGGLLVTLVNVFNPERVVIGGGVAQAGPLLLDPARDHLARHSLVARRALPDILPAALGTEAGLLGAASLLLDPGSTPEG
jgi:glucokinase